MAKLQMKSSHAQKIIYSISNASVRSKETKKKIGTHTHEEGVGQREREDTRNFRIEYL